MTAGPGASERPSCGCDVLCLFRPERQSTWRLISQGQEVQFSQKICLAAKQTNGKAPDDASSDGEDGGPYLLYHHELLASKSASSSESEDGPR